MTTYLVQSGPYYAKAIDGKPCFRSTQDRDEAARFETEEAAREWAPKVFRASMLAAVVIVAEQPVVPVVRGTNLENAIRRGASWVNHEDADEVLFGQH